MILLKHPLQKETQLGGQIFLLTENLKNSLFCGIVIFIVRLIKNHNYWILRGHLAL